MKSIRLYTFFVFLLLFSCFYHAEAQENRVIFPPEGLIEIGDEAFSDDTSISAVVIPAGVSISPSAFSGCTNLKTLIVLDGATVSFEAVFSSLPIENVYCMPGSQAEVYFGPKGINVYPLSDYTSGGEFQTEIHGAGVVITGYRGESENVLIPSHICGIPVTAIGDGAFSGNEKILSVSIPETVTSIGKEAFFGCRALENVHLPESIREIGSYAFQNVRNINKIRLSGVLDKLGDNPFLNCAMLSDVTGLNNNPKYAFENGMIVDKSAGIIISFLTNTRSEIVHVPGDITAVGQYAFSYAQTLTDIHFSADETEIAKYAFFECPSLKNVSADGTITRIGESAFRNCERLLEIPLLDGLVFVGDNAFRNCRSLKEKQLPSSVQTAGKDIFYLDAQVSGTVMNIVPLYQFHYTKTICVIKGEEKSVKTSGCGATCVAMIIRYMKGDYSVTPETVFEWLNDRGYYKGDGLSHLALSRYLSVSGISTRWTGNTTDVLDSLKAGKPVIAHMGPGTFADNGHYILLRGIDENGMILVNDPNSRRLTGETFSIQQIKQQLKTSDGFCLIK